MSYAMSQSPIAFSGRLFDRIRGPPVPTMGFDFEKKAVIPMIGGLLAPTPMRLYVDWTALIPPFFWRKLRGLQSIQYKPGSAERPALRNTSW